MREVGSSTHFDVEVASANVVSEEEVGGNGGMTTDLEQCHEIILRYRKLAATESTNGWTRTECSHIDHRWHRRLQESIRKQPDKEAIPGAPVAGPSTVKTFGSARSSSVALWMIYSACSSLIRPSRKKWSLRNSASGLPTSVFEKNTSSVGIIGMAGTFTYRSRPTSHPRQKTGSGETYLLDDTLSGTDLVVIAELGYIGSALDVIDCLLKLGLPNSHQRIGAWDRYRGIRSGHRRDVQGRQRPRVIGWLLGL